MTIEIRREEEKDYHQVEELTRKAFYNVYMPGCTEHYLVHIMRSHKEFCAGTGSGAGGYGDWQDHRECHVHESQAGGRKRRGKDHPYLWTGEYPAGVSEKRIWKTVCWKLLLRRQENLGMKPSSSSGLLPTMWVAVSSAARDTVSPRREAAILPPCWSRN